MKIAVVPARGGSKRIPEKNIKLFRGEPIILRTLATLRNSQLFDQIVISTDSEKIAETVSVFKEATISFRSEDLSNDKANIIDVISQVATDEVYADSDYLCCVYAPNPFLSESALELGMKVIEESQEINYVSSVTTYPFPIQRSLGFNGHENQISISDPKYMMTHSQDLEPRFHETAQFWWGRVVTWRSKKPMQEKMIGIYTPRWMSQDIDTPEDWLQAEIRWEILNRSKALKDYKFNEENIVTRNNF
jgi:pseudaminic acid cytidylyltransferase